MSYLQNPLNNYSIYSYNIAIYMINPQNLGNIPNITNKILIADNSKRAEYNIQSMEQTHTVGNDIVRATYANRFDIVITEPNGSTFFSKIVESSQQLGIPNHLKSMYVMEITFPARDEQNRPTRYPLKFYYPVTFVDVVANIDKGGSTYNITAYENSTMSYTYLNKVSQSVVEITGQTLGEVIANLEQRLNDAENANWQADFNSVYPNNVYSITFDEDTQDWANWLIESITNKTNTNPNNKSNEKMIFSLYSGTDITEFIGRILQTTVEYKRLPTYGGGFLKQDISSASDSGASKIPYTYKIIANVENLEYDILRQDYQKKINFKIKKHLATGLVVDPQYAIKTINNETEQKRRISAIRNIGLLRKRYDYIFTGKNTEVINFDIKLQYTYYSMTPIAGGQIQHDRLAPFIGPMPQTIRERVLSLKKDIANISNAIRFESGEIRNRLRAELDRLIKEFENEVSQLTEEDIKETKSPMMTFNKDRVDDAYTANPPTDVVGNSNIIMGSIASNTETSGDLVEIEIVIKGDPYWLGKPNSFYDYSVSDELADYELGGNLFYLKLNLPTQENSSGRKLVQSDYTITGVYRVINVINQFRNGLFTQYLKAYRDINIQPELVSSDLERNN